MKSVRDAAIMGLLLSSAMTLSNAFQLLPPSPSLGRNARCRSQSSSALSMCICINCARVTSCKAYHFVETKHNQPHMTEDPTFTPREGTPTIHVKVRTTKQDSVIDRMKEEHQAEEKLAEQEAIANQKDNAISEETEETELHGKTVYDISSATTIEYDVVACEDFIEDEGCWVRNMPEEIKAANPNFVPT